MTAKGAGIGIPLEREITDRILRALRRIDGCWCFKVLGGGGQMRGVPDIVGCWQGRFFALEVKRPKLGRTSAIQRKRLDDLRRAGAIVGVVHDVAEVMDLLGVRRDG